LTKSGKLVIDAFGSLKLYVGNGNLLRQHNNYPRPDNQTTVKPVEDNKEAQTAVTAEETQTTEPTKQLQVKAIN